MSLFLCIFFALCSFSFRFGLFFFCNSLNLSSSSYIANVSLVRSFNGNHYYTFAYFAACSIFLQCVCVVIFFHFKFKVTHWRRRNDSTRQIQNARKENMSVEIKTKMRDRENGTREKKKKDGRNKNVNDFE